MISIAKSQYGSQSNWLAKPTQVISALAVFSFVLCFSGLSIAQEQKIPASAQSTSEKPVNASDDFNRLVTQLVLDSIPHTFTEDKDWGGQKERFDGFKRTRYGLRVDFKTRKKLVNHGTWKKYDVSLRNPNEEFSVAVNNMRELTEGKIAFDIDFGAHLNVGGRQSKWVKGVQLYSLSATGHAKVRLRLGVDLEVTTDAKSFPPDLVFVPKIRSADISLDEFRIDRVGKAGGEFAQQASKQLRPLLEKKIADKERGLVKKLNAKISKKQDRLRLPIGDALDSKWSAAAKAFLPKEARQTIPTNPAESPKK